VSAKRWSTLAAPKGWPYRNRKGKNPQSFYIVKKYYLVPERHFFIIISSQPLIGVQDHIPHNIFCKGAVYYQNLYILLVQLYDYRANNKK
jgi:hypothetical protein